MIGQTSGVSAYSVIDQLTRPQAQTPPGVPTEQNNQSGSSTVADKTDISAKALALAQTLQQPGTTAEQQETRASEQGETQEEQAAPSPPPSQQQPQAQGQQKTTPSINIRV